MEAVRAIDNAASPESPFHHNRATGPLVPGAARLAGAVLLIGGVVLIEE